MLLRASLREKRDAGLGRSCFDTLMCMHIWGWCCEVIFRTGPTGRVCGMSIGHNATFAVHLSYSPPYPNYLLSPDMSVSSSFFLQLISLLSGKPRRTYSPRADRIPNLTVMSKLG